MGPIRGPKNREWTQLTTLWLERVDFSQQAGLVEDRARVLFLVAPFWPLVKFW